MLACCVSCTALPSMPSVAALSTVRAGAISTDCSHAAGKDKDVEDKARETKNSWK